MQTQTEIGAADDARIVFRLEETRAQLNPPRRQTGEAALELGATGAVAGHQDHQLGKPARAAARFPSANALFQPHHRFDDDVEILVLGPARRADDEPDRVRADAEPREERLAEALTVAAIDRRERRRGTIVQHVGLLHAEAAFEERREAPRHADVGVRAPCVAPLEPARQPHRRMPLAEPQLQHGVAEVVPVDDEADAAAPQREPAHGQRGKRGGILHEHQIGTAQRPQRAPQPEADAQGVEQAGDGVRGSRQLAADLQPRRLQAMDRDPRLVGNLARQRRPFEPDEVDVDAVGRQRMGVVPHAGAASQISEADDGGSHSGKKKIVRRE